jgi:PAS domain S-box-containing protein
MDSVFTSNKQTGVPVATPDFRLLFESAPGLFVVVLPDSPAFTIVAATDSYLKASRKSRQEIIGQSLFDVFFSGDDPAKLATLRNLRASFERVLSTRHLDTMPVQKYDLPAEGGGAEERFWSPVNSPVLGADGEVQFLIHRVEDVTDFVRLKRLEEEQGKLNEELRLRADQADAELILRSRQLAPSKHLLRERQDAEEKLLASEARFSMAFAEAPVGMVLTTPEGRILEVNQAYLQMLGYSSEELASRDSSHFTHPDDRAGTRKFVESLQDPARTTGTFEKRYIRKNGELLWTRVSATMRRGPDGEPQQIIAIIEDITERKRAEERLRAIYDGTYEYIGLLAPDGTLLEANRASLDFANNTRDDVVGLPFWETPWFAYTPGAKDAVREGVARAAAGEFVRYEATLNRTSGEESLTFDISLHPIRNQDGEVVLIVPEGRNITERKALELRDAFLVRLDDATRPLTDAYEITQTAARLLGEYLQVNRCAYADVEDDRDTFNLTGDYNRGVRSIVGRYTFTQFGDECRRLMRDGKPYVVEDSETDPRVDKVRDAYRLTSIRSVICTPLLKAGRFVAAMAVHQTTPRHWRQDEVEIVQLVANRCWESIERVHVTRELRQREQRFRFLAESIPQMVWTATPDGMLDYVNGQGCAFFGTSQQSLLGAQWLNWVHPDDKQTATERWQNSLATGKLYETSFRLLRSSDNTWRWQLVRALPLLSDAGNVIQWFGTCTDIEDQKQAEASLQQQWKTFDTALSHTPDFTYIFDLNGRFTYVNKSLLQLWQRTLEDSVGKDFFDLEYPTELAERLQSQIRQVIETKQPVRDQTPYTGAAGESRHYDYIFVPILDEEGRVEAVAGSTRDVTEQNLAAQQIEEDRRRWRELLFKTPAAIAILHGPQHTVVWVNLDYLRLLNRTEESLTGKSVLDALPEVERQIQVVHLDHVYQTGEPYLSRESLFRLNNADGSIKEVYLNFVYLPTRDTSGAIDGVFVHATDVTDTVLARKQVEESERQFRTLAETIPHLAWMADEAGYIFWYNQRWYDYTGTDLQSMAGWGWEKVHDPSVLPDVLKGWRAAISSGEPFEMVFPLKGADGTFRQFLTRCEPVRDNTGRVVRWFGTNTDITEQRRTEEELRRMNRELEEFAYVASHDLQEPLRMVNIYTHLILRTIGDTDGKLAQYSNFVKQGVTRMEALIHDLLTFSRTVHSEAPPAGTANLATSLEEAISVLKNRIEETGAVIVTQPLPAVCGDTAQIAHVFQNILSNALKYRKPEARPEIEISAELQDTDWVVSIRDNGIGFEPMYAERIFGLFKRLYKDEYPGTGLGLAICKRIVERYGGRMWAEGEPGKGATFRFSLPPAPAD